MLPNLLCALSASHKIFVRVARARKKRRSLADIIAEAPELSGKIAPDELKRLLEPANHVGIAPQLVDLAVKDAQRLWKS